MKTVVFLAAAESDLLEHFARLEEARPGTGDRFCRELDGSLNLVAKHPLIARPLRGKIRRIVLRRFHLGIFYAVESGRLMVCRILDLRQSPESLSRSLERFD